MRPETGTSGFGRAAPARLAAALALAALALCALAAPRADARPAGVGKDGRPNILVVMTDDMAAADVRFMPNTRRLLAKQGTTFRDAVDSFPLCCPARATFLTGQYAHNHGVTGNFYPKGWYGMEGRKNTLPAWLDKAGYDTAFLGKWLNGYGARDGHGEIPAGFDTWRGLLDLSSYDYYNFLMNQDGRLRAWGDPDFARKLVEFAEIQVVPPDAKTLAQIFGKLTAVMGPGPYSYWGSEDPADYSPDVTGRMTAQLVKRARKSKDPFFIWWGPTAPHREDVATTLMGRPGADPRAPRRYEDWSGRFELPRPPSFNEPDLTDKGAPMTNGAPLMSQGQVDQLQLDYEGRAGSLRAVDDWVGKVIRTMRRTRQLRNTMIMFISDNGWLQGQHRITGDKFLPYEESLRVPLILRGPGVPRGRTVKGQVGNIDFAPTLVDVAGARAGRKMDGVSLMPTVRRHARRPKRAFEIEAPRPLFTGPIPNNPWDRPYKGVRTDRYTYVIWTESGDVELYDRRKDPFQLRSVADDPAYAAVRARLEAKLAKLNGCKGRACRIIRP